MSGRRSSRGKKPNRKMRGRSSLPAAFTQMDSSAAVSAKGMSAPGADPTACPPPSSSGGAAQSVAPPAGVLSEGPKPVAGSLCFSAGRTDSRPGGTLSCRPAGPCGSDRAASDKPMGSSAGFPGLTRPWKVSPRSLFSALARPRNRFPDQGHGAGGQGLGGGSKVRDSPWTLGWGRAGKLGTGATGIFGGAGGRHGSAAGGEREVPTLPWHKGGDSSRRMGSVVGGSEASPFGYREPGSVTIDEANQAPVKQSKDTHSAEPRSDSLDNMELASVDTDKNLVTRGQTGNDMDRQLGTKFRAADGPHTAVGRGATPAKKAKLTFTSGLAEALDQPNADPCAAIRQTLRGYTDVTLRKVTGFYRQRLEEAIEECVEAVSLKIRHETKSYEHFYREIQRLVKDGSHRQASERLLDSVMESGAQAGRVMWETFIEMKFANRKLSNILQEIESKGANLRMEVSQSLMEPKVSGYLKDIQTQYKRFLLQANEDFWVNIAGGERDKSCLEECYTEQVIVVSGPEQGVSGHTLTVRGKRREEGQRKMIKSQWETVRVGQLFRSSFGKSNLPGTVVVSGPAGSGKTTMAQKIVRDWAEGKIYHQFHFVFLLKFRDLNSVAGRTSIKKLILDSYPHFGDSMEHLWEQPQGLLFILDSLEEFKEKIDFTEPKGNTLPERQCFHPECLCEVSDIVRCLIRQDVLRGCSVLLTTRPTELQTLRNAGVNLWAEIVGFLKAQRKEFLGKYFGDQRLAEAAFTYLEQNDILYSMCDNPSYCRIICYSLAPGLRRMQETQETLPTSVTQLFASYMSNIFKNHQFNIYKHHAVSAEQIRDLVLRTGQLAYLGICQNIHAFNESHLNCCNVERSYALPGFLIQHMDPSTSRSLFSFVHVTLQEFLAALSKYLTADAPSLTRFLTQLLDSPQGDDRFKTFLRFMVGLSSPGCAQVIKDLLGPLPHEVTCSVRDWVKTQAEASSSKRRLLESMHYLFESQHAGLMQHAVGLRGTLTLGDDFPYNALRLTPVDCTVLGTVCRPCHEVQGLNLSYCGLGTEGIQRLASALHKCKALRLRGNNLTDNGVKLLSETLKREDCQIQILDLSSNDLSHTDAQELAKGLSSNSSLTQLNLSQNKLGDTGVTNVCEALSSPQCKIQSLLLCENLIRGKVVEKLMLTLSTNWSLTSLNLNKNKLGDQGIRLMIAALGQRSCTLQTLELEGNGITNAYTEDLAVAPTTNVALTKVNLSDNLLTDQSALALSTLTRRHPSLRTIGLQRNKFSANGLSFLQSLNRPGLCVQVYTSIMSGGFKRDEQ